MPNGPYTGPLKVRVLPSNVFGEDLGRRNAPHKWANQLHKTCKHGHEYTPENTRMCNGHRICRTCDCLRKKRYRAKQ